MTCPIHRALIATCPRCPTYTVAPTAPVCPIHGTPQTSFCPRCRGSVGGKVVTPAKVRSLRRVTRERERNRKRKPMNGGTET